MNDSSACAIRVQICATFRRKGIGPSCCMNELTWDASTAAWLSRWVSRKSCRELSGLQALVDEQHIAEHVLKLGGHTPISSDTTQDGLGTCFDEQLGLRISCHEGIQIWCAIKGAHDLLENFIREIVDSALLALCGACSDIHWLVAFTIVVSSLRK